MSIKLETTLNASPNQVYQLLTDSAQFAAATGMPAEIEAIEGGTFTIFGGRMEGRQIELVPGERVIQAWRGSDWPEGKYSLVDFTLSPEKGTTKLKINQEAYPEGASPLYPSWHEHLSIGWPMFYFEPIEKYIEKGSQSDYACTIAAPVTANEAFEKIARVSDWWAKNFEGSARKIGDTFTVRFGETFVDFKISEAIPNKKIVWQVTNCYLPWLQDKTEWNGTSVAWDISSNTGITKITMTHHGLKPEVECYSACEKGWNGHIRNSLHQFLTNNKGFPE